MPLAACQDAIVKPSLSPTAFALLGLLSIRPWTAYELAKQTERSLNWFWPRTERKLYDEAKRLAHLGLAETTKEKTGERPRTVYRVTTEGRDALATWLALESAPAKLESEALLRVFFADGASLDELRSTLEQFALDAQNRLDVLAEMSAAFGEPDYPFGDRRHLNALVARFQFAHHRAAADWAAWALEQTAQWRTSTDAGGWDWTSAVPAPPEQPTRRDSRRK